MIKTVETKTLLQKPSKLGSNTKYTIGQQLLLFSRISNGFKHDNNALGKGDKSTYCRILTQRQQNETEATVLRVSLRCVGRSFIADSHGWVLTHAVPVFNYLLFSQAERLGTLKDFFAGQSPQIQSSLPEYCSHTAISMLKQENKKKLRTMISQGPVSQRLQGNT